ncbi:MAG: ParB/RepB/Spo0J family partition protein [Solobacterium sp.]|nr:ParB/RepB/Spo0J family partition protein [Solobacterium sp.]
MQFRNWFKDIYDKKQEQVVKIPVDMIVPSRYQPRLRFDETALMELAQSIQVNGLIQPITVRKVDDHYEIIAGERRYRACILAGYSEIPCFVMSPDEEIAAQMALVENVQRENLSAIEEAKSYVQIMRQAGLTQEEVASRIGKSQPSVANKIRLLNLPDEVQEAVVDGRITERHARALLNVPEDKVKEIFQHILEEKLNVSQSEAYIQRRMRRNSKRKNKTKGFTRNIQIALNSIEQCIEMIENLGIEVDMQQIDTEDELEVKIRLPKK